MSASLTVITAYLRPKDGAQERLTELRPDLERAFSAQMPGFVSATLLKVDGTDEWRDIVVLSDPAGVEAHLDSPAYDEWSSLVDVTSHDVSQTISHFER